MQGKRRYYFNINKFDNIDTPDKAYWIGFIYADGSIGRSGLRIEINNRDIQHLHMFNKFMESSYKIKATRKECCILILNSVIFRQKMQDIGILENKTKYYNMPSIPENMMKHFFRGLIDGDGWIVTHKTKRGPQYEFGLCSSHTEILTLFADFVKQNSDVRSTFTIRKTKTVNQIIIGGNSNFIKLVELLGYNKEYSMPRKLEKINIAIDDISNRIDARFKK